VHRDTVLFGGLLQLGKVWAILRAVPRIDGAIFEGLRLVGDDEVEVEVDGIAKALAARAGAEGVVEGEEARFWLAVLAMAGLALEGGGEAQALPFSGLKVAGYDLIKNFAKFAITDFGYINNANTVIGADYDAVDESEDGQCEVDLEQRFGY